MTDLVPSPRSTAISPYATAQSVRVSPDVLAADDPAAALAGRFLLRHPEGTRGVYRGDLQEWFAFCERLGVSVLKARLDHGDAFARFLAEAPRRKGRPLAPRARCARTRSSGGAGVPSSSSLLREELDARAAG